MNKLKNGVVSHPSTIINNIFPLFKFKQDPLLEEEVNPFQYWMKQSDEDGDGKLNQTEFVLFCEKIGLKHED